MSINDSDGNEIVRLPGFWEVIAKFSFAASVPVLLLGVSWACWVTKQVWQNTTEIAILKDVRQRPSGSMSNTVNVGDASAAAKGSAASTSAKTWLSTQEVAKRENVTDRTILNYIETGMIQPAPVKQGKTWVIAEHYRILPKLSELCGTETEPEETTP